MGRVRREPHENVATALVDPAVLGDVELSLMAQDLRVWPVATAPFCADGTRTAFQIRRNLLQRHRGEWDLAAGWTPIWVGFGPGWHDGDEPLPWAAHEVLWRVLGSYSSCVRFHRRLSGVRRVSWREDLSR